MTGNDDGGFSPHPGDPWHPGWSSDDEPSDDILPKPAADEDEADEERPRRKRRLFGRRSRDERDDTEDADDSDDSAEVPEDTTVEAPLEPAADEQMLSEPIPESDTEDPFDAVLRAEGRSVRRRPTPDDAPVPAWTSDEEIPEDLNLPERPPTWVGDTTAADSVTDAADSEVVQRPPTDQAELFEADDAADEPDTAGDLVEPDAPAPEDDSVPAVEADARGDDDAEIAAPAVAGEDLPADEEATSPAADDELPPIQGDYGVAGPEAFDALADTVEEDLGDWEAFMEGAAADTAPADALVEPETPVEPVGDEAAIDEWVESEEPKRKRRWFRRSKKDTDEVADDEGAWEDEAAWEEQGAWDDEASLVQATSPDDETRFMPPEIEQPEVVAASPDPVAEEEIDPDTAVAEALAALGVDADDAAADVVAESPVGGDDIVWTAEEGEISWVDEATEVIVPEDSKPLDDEVIAELGDTDAVVDDAALADDVVVVDDAALVDDVVVVDDAVVDDAALVDDVVVVDDAVVDDAAVVEDESGAGDLAADADELVEDVLADAASATEPIADEEQSEEGAEADAPPFFLGEVPAEDSGRPVAEEVPDWDGDPSQVPASWFADVDEDTVVPPVAADTPETEWRADEGPWEGRAAWHEDEPTEVFDVESAAAPLDEVEEPLPQLDDQPVVPEGYQDWGEAVADATADVGDETAEYHVQHVPPPAQELPEGFEPFPGGEAETAYGDGPAYVEDQPMSDETFDDAPVASDVDDASEFDEHIYASGGTVEHRGLAEAIAAVGDEDDTEWQAMSAAMAGVETGVLGFEDVADLASGDEYVAPVRSNLGVRVLTGLVLAGLLFGSLFVGGWAFALFVGAIVLLGLGELYTTLSRQGYLPLTIFGMIGAAATLAATWFHGPVAIPSGIILTTVVVFFFYAFTPTRRDALTDGGVTVAGMAWVIGGVSFAIPIARAPEFEIIVLAIVATTAAMDIGAFSFGRRWGRRPLAPVLSPNKTLEGLIGGVLLAFAVAAAFGYFELGPFDLGAGLALGAVVAVAAPLGDLAESMVKRAMGVKDMGSTLPGHGGVLDRIDALVFVIPSAWVLLQFIGFLG